MKRYEKFADDIAELIRTGVLRPGQRVPSVRYASQTHGVSPSTVFQAYYLLERRGLIRADRAPATSSMPMHHGRFPSR